MVSHFARKARGLGQNLARVLIGPQTLAFLPALTLAAYWYGGEVLLLFVAILIPGIFAVTGMYSGTGPAWAPARDGDGGRRPLRAGPAPEALSGAAPGGAHAASAFPIVNWFSVALCICMQGA